MSVWDYATKIKKGLELSGQCNSCNKIIKCSKRSTTSLKEHLRTHGIIINKLPTSSEPKAERKQKPLENPEVSLKKISKRLQVKKTETKTASKEYENCFICNVYLGPYRNALNSYIEDSDQKIFEQIETLISTRVPRRASKHSSICQDCFSKLSKYNSLQREANEIQQNLYNLYHSSHGTFHKSEFGEFVSVKIEDTSEDYNQPAIKLNCQKCHCTFDNLYEMSQHKNCRNIKIDNSKISNEFIQQAEDAGIDYDFSKFQKAFFSKYEMETFHKVKSKKLTIPEMTKELDEKISPDFKRVAKDKGIDYDIETFHKAFGGEQQNEDAEKKKGKKLNIKTNHGVSKEFLKQLQTDGIDYNLELFQKVFGYTDNLDYHRKLYKLDYGDGENAESSVKCKHCKETFTNRSKFVQHMRTHKTREFFCEECDKDFRTKVCLVIHNATDHERKKTDLECPVCFKVYTDRTALRTHYHIHIGDRSYLCGICGADFFHKKSFEMHSMMHEDIRPFACDICHKTFRTKGKLTIHLRVHTGEKKYECPHCPGKRFAQKYGMDLHIKKTHMNLTQNYTEQCRICGMHLQNRSKLKQHLANAHQVADDDAGDDEGMELNYR